MTGRDDMDAAEMALRKFLKQLGVTAHQEVARALAAAVAEGRLESGALVPVKVHVEIDGIAFTHEVSGQLIAPR